jgi:3-oxoacyl-[acyl-carrier protein] reductase
MSPSPDNLQGLTAVVTGASSGIGRAMALELAARGADVVVHARQSGDAAQAVADEIRRQGREALVLLADVSDASQRERLVADAWSWREGLDVWINNAGADLLTGPAASLAFMQKLDLLWQVDVLGTIALSRDVGQRMQRLGGGTIINVGWDQAEQGMEGDSGELFAASKGAIMAFTRSLARSLAPEVRVNCLAPGWIRTAWGEQAPESWQQRAQRESQLGRWGTPQDIARAACFLASPDAALLTGQVLPVNGGFRAG